MDESYRKLNDHPSLFPEEAERLAAAFPAELIQDVNAALNVVPYGWEYNGSK